MAEKSKKTPKKMPKQMPRQQQQQRQEQGMPRAGGSAEGQKMMPDQQRRQGEHDPNRIDRRPGQH
ncbi:hypothetical protein [Nocardia sp. NPDC051463]|uniref:hypothetical protein n=1 Tax=Nocardia sp. NPDC051463 TaxID=3154845 RepID=UPI00344CA372